MFAEANKLEEFISLVKQKSLWIVAATMFGVCATFIGKSYVELPEKYLAHQQYAETLSNLEAEQGRRSRVIELYEKSMKDFGPLLQFYIDNIQPGNSEARRNAAHLRSVADRTSAQLRADISESEGILLQGDTYQKLHLRLVDGSKLILELSDAFRVASSNVSSDTVRRTLRDKYQQVMLTNRGIAESVIDAFSTQVIADRHPLEKKIGELTMLNRQSWLVLCAALYIALFAVFCIVRFLRFRQSSHA